MLLGKRKHFFVENISFDGTLGGGPPPETELRLWLTPRDRTDAFVGTLRGDKARNDVTQGRLREALASDPWYFLSLNALTYSGGTKVLLLSLFFAFCNEKLNTHILTSNTHILPPRIHNSCSSSSCSVNEKHNILEG